MRALPDFLIIGAMKGGTTSLFEYLRRHPGGALPDKKDLHFFDGAFERGVNWYRSHFCSKFRQRTDELLVGEATPRYLFEPVVPERVQKVVPDAKFIALLRDPVARAYSQYHHADRKDRDPDAFEQAAEREIRAVENSPSMTDGERGYVRRGLYAEQLERWFARFPRERFLILASENFNANRAETLDEVCRFLSAAPFDWQADATHRRSHNQHPYPSISDAVRERLADWFAPHNRRLYELLDRDFGW